MITKPPDRTFVPTSRTIRWTSILLATTIWLPALHLFYAKPIQQRGADAWAAERAPRLAAHLTERWEDPDLLGRDNASMASINPEWDFMSRTYLVLGLANLSLRRPDMKPMLIAQMDRIIDDTLRTEREKGFMHFLMRYGQTTESWIHRPPQSLFVDGEIALMVEARRLIEEKPAYKTILAERVRKMMAQMSATPTYSAESYPNECWLFCNTVALAAIKIHGVLDGASHKAFLQRWLAISQARLKDEETGLLISAYAVDGSPAICGRRPEGSSIWMAAHMLQIVDPAFAQDQYQRARQSLGRTLLGFGYSREWPSGRSDYSDVDSGPLIPGLGASASASGLAILAAHAFHDDHYYVSLLTSLQLAGFPRQSSGTLSYQAGNTVGEAVIFYGWVVGPLWDEVHRRERS